MSSDLIYLDYAATTPLNEQVAERMRIVQGSAYFNPASNHAAGWLANAVPLQAVQAENLMILTTQLVSSTGNTLTP